MNLLYDGGIIITNIKKIAELILLKDKEYTDKDKLKHYFKKYVNITNEIGILEDSLKELNNRLNLNMGNEKYLTNEINEYMESLNKLKHNLDKLNNNIDIINYQELNEYINKLKNVSVDTDDSLNWDIFNKIEGLKLELENIRWELEMAILNYGLQKLEINYNHIKDDLFEYTCKKIIQQFAEKQEQKK
ncbi:hypothetical protein [Methanococcus aeolicus]|uniref:hypothetical protein n=1 Tax=Methanococcus aeolicus TaxID=42879 RepID=UPI0021C99AA3|nr:hypothetical protein [Methanococcus aeolicus]UXM85064.1 hypothetical protein N6C89_01935 [Methanococcus aeolicus]